MMQQSRINFHHEFTVTHFHHQIIQGRILTCGGPWSDFSSGAVKAHPTLEYPTIQGDKTYVEPQWLFRSLGKMLSFPSPKSDPEIIQNQVHVGSEPRPPRCTSLPVSSVHRKTTTVC